MFQFSNRIELDQEKIDSYESFFGINQPRQETQKPNNDEELSEQEQKVEEELQYQMQLYEERKELQAELQERKIKATEILENTLSPVEAAIVVRKLDQLFQPQKERGEDMDLGGKVWIIPTLQLPYIGFKQDEELFYKLTQFLRTSQDFQDSELIISSGYINLTKQLKQILFGENVNKTQPLKLITSAPQANSFYKGGRVKGLVPYFYRIFEKNILTQARKTQSQLEMFEYLKPGWSFHSKGVWIRNQSHSPFTLLGSSNYSQRSFQRDSELNFYLVSECEIFQRELSDEIDKQFEDAAPITEKEIKSDRSIKLGLKTHLLSKILSSFL